MILITGDKGYIGTHLTRVFAHSYDGCDISTGRDYRAITDTWWDIVIHLAASVSVTESFKRPMEYFDNNALGISRFLSRNRCRRFILVSTGGAMYGDAVLAKEEDAAWAKCQSPYAQSKFLAESIVSQHPGHIILRLGNVYGGDMTIRGEANCHSHFAQDNPIRVYGGTQTRDFIHVDVVCEALNRAMTIGTGVYNIGSGQESSVKSIAEDYARERGVDIEYCPSREEVERISLDITRAKSEGLL